MNQKLAFIIFAFAFVVAIVAGFYSPSEGEPKPSDFRAKVRENLPNLKSTLKPKKVGGETSERRPASVPNAAVVATSDLNTETFSNKYGDGFSFEQTEGRVTRIDGTHLNPETLNGSARVDGFRVMNQDDLLARANEVLADTKALLGMDADTTFLPAQVEASDTTGRVVYQQSIDGVPVYPGGTVTMIVGSNGEVRALDSSVYPKTKVLNVASLPAPENTRKVLFVTESAPVALLRYGYDSRVKGIQTITDAQTADVLFQRDRKIR